MSANPTFVRRSRDSGTDLRFRITRDLCDDTRRRVPPGSPSPWHVGAEASWPLPGLRLQRVEPQRKLYTNRIVGAEAAPGAHWIPDLSAGRLLTRPRQHFAPMTQQLRNAPRALPVPTFRSEDRGSYTAAGSDRRTRPPTLQIRSPAALRPIVQPPGELAFGRPTSPATSTWSATLRAHRCCSTTCRNVKLRPSPWMAALSGSSGRARSSRCRAHPRGSLHGRRHSNQRDAAASRPLRRLERLIITFRGLGPSMTTP